MKLVRDNIPLLHAQGELGPHPSGVERSRQVFRRATREEYQLLLLAKLAEEVGEVISAMTREHRLEELGDLREVISAIEDFESCDEDDLNRRKLKTKRFGGFADGFVLEWTQGEK